MVEDHPNATLVFQNDEADFRLLPGYVPGAGPLYSEGGEDYAEPEIELATSTYEWSHQLGEVVLVHCHDWQTALVPIYLHTLYAGDRFFRNTSVLLTIHNLAYQGIFPPEVLSRISLRPEMFTVDAPTSCIEDASALRSYR